MDARRKSNQLSCRGASPTLLHATEGALPSTLRRSHTFLGHRSVGEIFLPRNLLPHKKMKGLAEVVWFWQRDRALTRSHRPTWPPSLCWQYLLGFLPLQLPSFSVAWGMESLSMTSQEQGPSPNTFSFLLLKNLKFFSCFFQITAGKKIKILKSSARQNHPYLYSWRVMD